LSGAPGRRAGRPAPPRRRPRSAPQKELRPLPGRPARRLEIADRYRPRTPRRLLEPVVAAALRYVGQPRLQVSLLLTGDAQMAALHGKYLGARTTTDVISFAMDGGVDIAVNVACARREAARRGHSIRAEIALYVVHGILHACGYDDSTAAERRRMRAAEANVLRALRLRCAPVDG
jgi:probable rRNA maturation factor